MERVLKLFVKSVIALLLIYIVFGVFEIQFPILPCDSEEGCRQQNVIYLDDNHQKYVYKKKSVNDLKSKALNYNDIKSAMSSECYRFLFTLLMLVGLIVIADYIWEGKISDSVFLGLFILIFVTFFPLSTLHAVDSNVYSGKLFKDLEGNRFIFETSKISNS